MKRILTLILSLCLLLCACASRAEEPTASPETEAMTEKPTEPPTEAPTEPPTEPPTVEEKAQERIETILGSKLSAKSASLSVDEMYQYPELPTGCEAVALTIALNALGCDLDKTEIAENYLIYDANYAIGYCGDPFSNGGAGIWPIGIVRTVEKYTEKTGKSIYAFNTSGRPLKDLCKLVDAGCPVLVWTTYYMNEPMYTDEGINYDGEYYQWYDNEHCVTMYGYDSSSGTVDISDPLRGKVTVDAQQFERLNDAIGGWSVALLDTSDL